MTTDTPAASGSADVQAVWEALEPFATLNVTGRNEEWMHDTCQLELTVPHPPRDPDEDGLTVGDFRRARSALPALDAIGEEMGRMREMTGASLTLGGGHIVHGAIEDIGRAQNLLLIDSTHPIEKEDVRRSLARDLQKAETELVGLREFIEMAGTGGFKVAARSIKQIAEMEAKLFETEARLANAEAALRVARKFLLSDGVKAEFWTDAQRALEAIDAALSPASPPVDDAQVGGGPLRNMIGPLVDAWEQTSNDTRSVLREDEPRLAGWLDKIAAAADGRATPAPEREGEDAPTNIYQKDAPEYVRADWLFKDIYAAIRHWDIGVPGAYGGYCGATGSHAYAIWIAARASLNRQAAIRAATPTAPDRPESDIDRRSRDIIRRAAAILEKRPTAPDRAADALREFVPTHRHYKGGLYKLLLIGDYENSPEQKMAVYQAADGRVWVRQKEQFDDRFAPIEDAALQGDVAAGEATT